MQSSFGYFTADGGYNGQIFTVVIGETGSFYTAVRLCDPHHMPDCCQIYAAIHSELSLCRYSGWPSSPFVLHSDW